MHRTARFTLALAVGVTAAGASAFACGTNDPAEPSTSPPSSDDAGIDAAPVERDAGTSFCADGKPTVDYPPGPYAVELLNVLPPDLAFSSPDGPVRLKDYFDPCAPKATLLVVRTLAAWCGSCDWSAKHTKELFVDAPNSDRVRLLDLLVADEDNMPPTDAALVRWRERIGGVATVAADPTYTFSTAFTFEPLPAYVFIDTRTMEMVTTQSDPTPDAFAGRVALELAELDGEPRPPSRPESLYDGLFPANRWDLIRGMRLEDAPPPDPTNEYADDPAAAELGQKLFSDATLSPSGTVSCATCHDATKAFADGVSRAVGVAVGDRNSPSVTLAAHARWQFWDGRADTLWMQALGPFENDKEFGSSRLHVAHRIQDAYGGDYQRVFGGRYPLPDLSTLPASGKPGDAKWDELGVTERDAVTRIYVNVGKAIAAFERTLRAKPNALDRYADGDKAALTEAQKGALVTFFSVGCHQCHWGPRLTDDAFHTLRFPTGRQDNAADRGRIDILPTLASAEFVATSRWSDDPTAAKLLAFDSTPSMLGAFRTPALRGIAQTAPYGHGGQFATLLEVAKHYGQRAAETRSEQAAGAVERWVPNFDTTAQASLPTFLEVLTVE